ncbi:MAG: hypothetical protein AB7O73_11080 [Bacteroidia bacterium]
MKNSIIYFLISIVITVLLLSCNSSTNNHELINYENNSKHLHEYKLLCDSFEKWKINKLHFSEAELIYNYILDSLLCFNQNKNQFISCRHLYDSINKNVTSDDLQFIYGILIRGNWYFYRGPSIVIPREMVKDQPENKPLSYQQLHHIALNEVYSGYLNADGSINEEWFNQVYSKKETEFKSKEDFEKFYIAISKLIWLEKYSPYKQEDFEFEYNNKDSLLLVKTKLKPFDSIYCQPINYKLLYEYEGLGYIGNIFFNDFSPEIDWYKNPYMHDTIKHIPPGKEVKIYLEVLHYPYGKSPRYGPFIYTPRKDLISKN